MPNTIIRGKKIEHLWSVLSASSSVDQQTNSLSIFNVVEEITITSIPQIAENRSPKDGSPQKFSIPLNLTITSLWQRNDDVNEGDMSVDARIRFTDPKGEMVNQNPLPLSFKKGFKRLRAITMINAITFTTPGEYRFVIEASTNKGFEEVCSIPLQIKIQAKI